MSSQNGLTIGSEIELASSQVNGFLLPEGKKHSLAVGIYRVVEERSLGVTLECNGQRWTVLREDIIAVTARTKTGRSYKPLTA